MNARDAAAEDADCSGFARFLFLSAVLLEGYCQQKHSKPQVLDERGPNKSRGQIFFFQLLLRLMNRTVSSHELSRATAQAGRS